MAETAASGESLPALRGSPANQIIMQTIRARQSGEVGDLICGPDS